MKRIQLHQSGLGLFGRCGEAFRRRYVEGEILAPSSFIVVGRAADAAISADLISKMKRGQLLGTGEVVDIAAGIVEREFLEPVDLRDERISKGTLRDLAINRAKEFARWTHANLVPKIQPKAVQRPWSIRMDDIFARRGLKGLKVDFVGTMDIEEWIYDFSSIDSPKGTSIRDIKTSGKNPPKDAVSGKHFIQMTSYAFGKRVLDGTMPERVQVDYLVDLKRGIEHTPVTGTINDSDFAALFNRLENIAWALKAGVFAPAPRDHWTCSEKWCGYWHRCPYVHNDRVTSLSVPKPRLYKIAALPERTKTNGNSIQAAGISVPAKPDQALVANSAPNRGLFLVARGPELDPTDD